MKASLNFSAASFCPFARDSNPTIYCKCSLYQSSATTTTTTPAVPKKPTKAPITTTPTPTLAPGVTTTLSDNELLCVRRFISFV